MFSHSKDIKRMTGGNESLLHLMRSHKSAALCPALPPPVAVPGPWAVFGEGAWQRWAPACGSAAVAAPDGAGEVVPQRVPHWTSPSSCQSGAAAFRPSSAGSYSSLCWKRAEQGLYLSWGNVEFFYLLDSNGCVASSSLIPSVLSRFCIWILLSHSPPLLNFNTTVRQFPQLTCYYS